MPPAIGGSPLANYAEPYQAVLLQYVPRDLQIGRWWRRAEPKTGDPQGVARALAQHPLPGELHYYSIVRFPEPERISSILKSSYNKLSRFDSNCSCRSRKIEKKWAEV
ncbi:hypothetical protein [Cupriavidus sp. YR651]|uniref:hypothetical protein n=1 Tax=Cupriavidus sp. YR651 TaxID=1855315 RepID=UPI000AA5AC36|nr:hypothetical protein [Cupriavidus sp. YR651]